MISNQNRPANRERGIILVTFAASALVLILFLGLAIDVGFLYMTRAALSKGTDSAALMGVRMLSQGPTIAAQDAQAAFYLNYQASSLPLTQSANPTVSITFSTDSTGLTSVKASAQVTVKTFLIRVLPQFTTVLVSSSAQAVRARLVMSIVLDRSGSMLTDGGASALPGAVTSFINFFDNANDRVALASFGYNATLDVPMGYNFKTPIINSVNNINWEGWTYAQGGIDIGRAQINSVPVDPNLNTLHVLVFFTDGQANSFLGNPNCQKANTPVSLVLTPGSGTSDFYNPSTGAAVTCKANLTQTFYSNQYQANRTRNTTNVTNEGLYMAKNSAKLARQDGTLVFSIGLGSDIDTTELHSIANDSSSPTFDPTQPVGQAVFAPTSSQLQTVFQQIAAQILLRLTQ